MGHTREQIYEYIVSCVGEALVWRSTDCTPGSVMFVIELVSDIAQVAVKNMQAAGHLSTIIRCGCGCTVEYGTVCIVQYCTKHL